METNYSLSDIASVSGGNGFGGNWILIILFAMIFGWGGNGFGRGDYGQFASAASQQEILFGQQFQNLDNKMDRLGNGIADATFALNNSVKDGNFATQKAIDGVRFDMSNYVCNIKENDNANTQKILDVLAQNKIETLQGRINQLELQAAMCGVVRYPNQLTYNAGGSPFCNCGGCGCGNM